MIAQIVRVGRFGLRPVPDPDLEIGGVGWGGGGWGLGCVCPDPEIREGPSLQKKFFGPLGLSLL